MTNSDGEGASFDELGMSGHVIPRIDVGDLFCADGNTSGVDAAILRAARSSGMMAIHGLPRWAILEAQRRRELLAIFMLPEAEIRKLWRWAFDARQPNVYRGWFPLQNGHATYKEGIDLGPDVVGGPSVVDPGDPLREATPLPDAAALAGWRERVRDYYVSMTRLSATLMRSIARGLALPDDTFDAAFTGGNSTLRLLRYPVRPPASFDGADPEEVWTEFAGKRREVQGRAHVDSGFMTLLAQDGVGGLQAQFPDGAWVDVPPEEGSLAVNFGKVLERWTGGLIRATVHRVLGSGEERFSIPFFYEARVDAVIAPLPLAGATPFEPFSYGDHLWEATTQFVEQKGIKHLRKPRGIDGRSA
jgi:isopenicillin N synthase-like dioxygenase